MNCISGKRGEGRSSRCPSRCSKVHVEERGEVGALIRDGPVGVDGADELLHGVGREAEHTGRLGDQGLQVGERVVGRAGQLQVESPAALVGPELRPRLVVVASVVLGWRPAGTVGPGRR